MQYAKMNVRFGARDGARVAAALLTLSVVGCANIQDTSELEEKIAQAEKGSFGVCMDASYRAAVELQEARMRLEELKAGSPSDTDLREGMRAAETAVANREKAEQKCASEYRMANAEDAARIAELQAQLSSLSTRLNELESHREVLRGVTFDTGSSALSPRAKSVLGEQVPNLLRKGVRVRVAGYASSTGGDNYNRQLSQKRADAVRSYFIEKGVNADALVAMGFGTADPRASNATASGRRANQRIELQYLK